MKKLLLVLAFAFIGGQAFSQMYIVTLVNALNYPSAGCNEFVLLKVDPTGVESTTCISQIVQNGALSQLNQEFNSLISQGYKMMELENSFQVGTGGGEAYIDYASSGDIAVWFFAIP
tara:strand:+ start:618 stop:968 length:351 start_codon:yes stop_codon:yes gene_type:complete